MLETFMIATEPWGTWGPGPISEPVGYWPRIFDSVANDPRAVATIFAAFVGFLFGVLIKYGLDRRADRLRKQTDRRALATALRAELLHFDVECDSRIEGFEQLLNENPEEEVFGGPRMFVLMALPPRRVWMEHLGRIGDLEGYDPDTLMMLHSMLDFHDLRVESLRQRASDQGVERDDLKNIVDRLKKTRDLIVDAGEMLLEQTKIEPSLWRRVLRFKDHFSGS